MKTIIFLITLLWWHPTLAKDNPKQHSCIPGQETQFISIVEQGGTYQILNKNDFEGCSFGNHQQKAVAIWQFLDMPICQQDHKKCEVLLDNPTNGGPKKATCKPNSQPFECELQLSHLKKHCDTNDPNDPQQCRLVYRVVVDEQEIDPTILINPRPLY